MVNEAGASREVMEAIRRLAREEVVREFDLLAKSIEDGDFAIAGIHLSVIDSSSSAIMLGLGKRKLLQRFDDIRARLEWMPPVRRAFGR